MSTISLFGPVGVSHGAFVARGPDFGGRKPVGVLALLALAPGVPRTRDEIAEALWEGRPPRGYVATLHGYVSLLRRGLSMIGAGPVLVTSAHGYLLDPDLVTVDLHQGLAMLASGDPDAVLDALDLAARGLLVDVPYAEWATRARSEWDDAVAMAATRAAGVAREQGEPPTAVRLARAALRSSPYCEGALRELMSALAASGQTGRAVQAFEEARGRYEADLGVGLGPETEELYLHLLRPQATRSAGTVPALIRLLREALQDQAALDLDDPVVRDVSLVLMPKPKPMPVPQAG
ncbi:hypothetical protein KDN32_13970 [Nocardioides sp. J2M5]|uniref:AfsR/SARP family transcriptional regulator n=1 Tax=Nocardioides palaemonis TaxID=2829810 RepID=UPI001BA48FF8|nr:BTAD domain-containing putative transcriptional regulator [Nocardioides palaemonis]MBS2938845.1 hypothetical protein [Nocardioides palaemonis]